MNSHKGFTLLELLVVIAILAVLSAVTVVVLNPAELLRRSRDSQRLNDLAAITSAISFYMTETTTPNLSGDSTPNSSCANNKYWVSVTSGYGTGAGNVTTTPAADAGKVDGTGWIRVNLASLSTGSPIPAFPVDPVNSGDATGTALELFYTYLCRGTPLGFQLVANLESSTYKPKEGTDGGAVATLYETGTIANYGVNLTTLYPNSD